MKHVFTLLFCIGLLNGLHAQNLPSYLPANGLVGWWPFNGNAQDESGNGNHGTVNGATLAADRFGNVEKAYDFNGTSNFIDMGNSPNLSFTGSFTVACWINPDSVPRPFNQNGFNTMAIVDKAIQNTLGGYRLDYTADSLLRIVGFQFQLSNANIRTRRWTHLVYTLNSSNQTTKIYFNGVLDKTIVNVSAPTISSTNLWVGAASATNGFPDQLWFGGKIDDIAIYNSALSQEEITQLYQAGNENSLSYQLSQQKLGNCATSPVKLSVKTSVKVQIDSTGSIGGNTATAYGNILNDGGKTITRRGFCWGTSANPTLSNSFSENGSGSGTFSGSLSGLSPSTTYYLRAYAGTETEVWYGNEISFTTASGSVSSATCGTPNIHNPNLSYGNMTDQDGNSYKTIVIGSQEWMAENLKTRHYRNGDIIPIVTSDSGWTEPASCWFNNDSVTYSCPYGRYYNWYAVTDPRGICPAGWHFSSDEDWKTLEQFLGMPEKDLDKFRLEYFVSRGDSQNIGGILKSAESNESGFSALLGGWRVGNQFLSEPDGSYPLGFFWTALDFDANGACIRLIAPGPGGISRLMRFGKNGGLSARCVKDDLQNGIVNFERPEDTGTIFAGQPISEALTKVIYTGGNGESYDGQTVASTGVSGMTASLGAGNFGQGNGMLIISIDGIPASSGEAFFTLNLNGQLLTFSRMVIAAGAGLTDIDGNVYQSIIIGNQEWMRENLKVSRYRNADPISEITTDADWQSTSTGAFGYLDNNQANNALIGKLYNWYAVSDSRKLCPTGWHEPSDSEWSILENSLGGARFAGGKMKTTGTTESGTGLWGYPNFSATNESGFSVVPGVRCEYDFDYYDYLSGCSSFWSSTENSSTNALSRYVRNNAAEVVRKSAGKNAGYSVRCLKD